MKILPPAISPEKMRELLQAMSPPKHSVGIWSKEKEVLSGRCVSCHNPLQELAFKEWQVVDPNGHVLRPLCEKCFDAEVLARQIEVEAKALSAKITTNLEQDIAEASKSANYDAAVSSQDEFAKRAEAWQKAWRTEKAGAKQTNYDELGKKLTEALEVTGLGEFPKQVVKGPAHGVSPELQSTYGSSPAEITYDMGLAKKHVSFTKAEAKEVEALLDPAADALYNDEEEDHPVNFEDQGEAVQSWAVPSDRGTTVYEVTKWEDGSYSCNCPGWVCLRKGKNRGCKHTRLAKRGQLPSQPSGVDSTARNPLRRGANSRPVALAGQIGRRVRRE